MRNVIEEAADRAGAIADDMREWLDDAVAAIHESAPWGDIVRLDAARLSAEDATFMCRLVSDGAAASLSLATLELSAD